MSSYYFTMYTTKPKLLFKLENLNKNPLRTEQEFFAQFALDVNKYRDNNNFIEVHEVYTYDNRIIT